MIQIGDGTCGIWIRCATADLTLAKVSNRTRSNAVAESWHILRANQSKTERTRRMLLCCPSANVRIRDWKWRNTLMIVTRVKILCVMGGRKRLTYSSHSLTCSTVPRNFMKDP
jgi:hypothetical protein